ncbi:hypothetical protein SR42_14200 [Clostridium botulinum]|uniref:hypothetical protein n=1 Tax=Clostridium botulinum TaxID=1491 RepID=UPI000596B59B|nr:hypothetical protein [Clostridium botulinum]KIL07334.1 hypothetical protein SR42_14200 [Clostridium botulinum]MBY6934373.1 hypothetical protein [Clostridium botulinum]NFN12187.1 hypothetical protein [Clostridium botulinum]NFO37647.1 hypothetical protein [Clostridium botulinum]NFO43944.1 hypothetical protein [Clostridium botulinum]
MGINYIENIVKKYNEEQFKQIISLLSHKELIQIIKNNPKYFEKELELRGYRLETLIIKKIQNVYFKRIYKEKDMILAKYLYKLISDFKNNTNKQISKQLNIDELNLNKVDLYQIGCCLLDTKFKNNMEIYFIINNRKIAQKDKYALLMITKFLGTNRIRDTKLKIHTCNLEIENLKKATEKYKETLKLKDIKIQEYNNKIRKLKQNLLKMEEENKQKIVEFQDRINRLDNLHEERHNSIQKENNALENEKKELIKKQEQKDSIIKNLNSLLNDEYNKNFQEVKKKFIKENDVLVKENINLKRINLELEDEKKKMESIIRNLKYEESLILEEKEEIKENINILKKEAGNTVNSIGNIIKCLDIKPISSEQKIYKYRVLSEITNSQGIIEDRDEFIDALKINLTICGIDEKCSYDLAEYIFAMLSSNMNLLFIGSKSREITNAISYLICEESAEFLNIPIGYKNSRELIDMVRSADSDFVLIENSINYIEENVYLALIKQNIQKNIIFSIDNLDDLVTLSANIFNYVGVVDLDRFAMFENYDTLLSGLTSSKIFKMNLDCKEKKKNLRKLKKMDLPIKISNIAKVNYSELLTISDYLNSKSSIYKMMIFGILVLCESNKIIVEFNQFIKSLNLENDQLELLQKYIEEVEKYE